ncbi:FecR family protein [Methylobacterium terricola]|uniref:FecR family protein n=1 Tax=Methylobacterium terricola TaxID=2583531 RepID=A0A5C4L8S5_9HYPH|nr:FecR family protein [Methylobacterium terricola]TNC08159.1 FecR family protein [Methylobacterium terricola]
MTARTPPEKSDETGDNPVYEAAALWVARLSSADATDADREAFAVWRATDPAHEAAYAEMESWRRTMGQVPDPRRSKPKAAPGLIIVAALGLVGILGWQLGLVDRLRADDWTDVGEIRSTILADGSRVDLNTDTAIALHDTPRERGVELLRGEAVFDVVPDPQRPFVVRGHGIRARAVGTRFFVRADGIADPVGVAEGRVDVATGLGHVLLQAGEVASQDATGRPVARTSDVAQAIAWREGRLVFSGQPLSQVLAELGRYRRGRILLTDAAIGERRFSGTLDPRDTGAALAILSATMGIRVINLTPLLTLVR